MDRHRTAIGLLLVVMVGGTARGANWAEALFAESGHDFGPVPRGAKLRHAFVLTNRLAEPVTILNVRASCGCTTGRANVSIVPPGQTAVVEAEMDTRNFVNRKETTLYVTLVTAGGKEAEARFKVASTILSDIVLNPGTIDFGTVARGQSPRKTLTLDRDGLPGWEVTRMLSSCKRIDAQMDETTRSGAQVRYTLTVTLKPDTPAGTLRDEIRVLTNDPESPSIPILVTAQVRGDLSATPSMLALGAVTTAAGGAQGRFLVRGSRPFAITGLEGAGDGFKITADDATSKAAHLLTVTYRPDEGTSRGDLRRTFRLATDLPGEPPLELPVTLHVDP